MKVSCDRCEFDYDSGLGHCPRCGKSVSPDAKPAKTQSRQDEPRINRPKPTVRPRPTAQSRPPKKDRSLHGATKALITVFAIFMIMGIIGAVLDSSGESPGSYTYTPKPKPKPQTTDFYVSADVLNVRSAPTTDSTVLSQASKWDTLKVKKVEGAWATIRRRDGSTAYVAANYLKPGSGVSAKARYCVDYAGPTPANGEILARSLSDGFHHLNVTGGPQPTVVKLKDAYDRDVLSFYVAPRSVARITNIPDGSYTFYFANGRTWSRSCNTFVPRMHVSKDPQIRRFTGNSYGMYSETQYQLVEKVGGNLSTAQVSASEF